jgi:hypothetical protein
MSIAAEALAAAQALQTSATSTGGPAEQTTEKTTEQAAAAQLAEATEPAQESAPDSKGLSWAEEVKKLPPELQSLARGLQGMVTRKTQQLADERKALAAEREAWRKSITSLATAPQAELPEIDSWNPDSIQARIEAEVSRRLAEALAPVESEYRAAQADMEFDRFTQSHPDLLEDAEVKSGVAELLRKNDALDLETAYFAVKGRLNRQAAPTLQPVNPQRAAAKKAAAITAPARRPPPEAPIKMSPADLKKATPEQILAYAKSLAERKPRV